MAARKSSARTVQSRRNALALTEAVKIIYASKSYTVWGEHMLVRMPTHRL